MRRRRLTLEQIEAFQAVMLTGSVSAAARQLNVSQPSLTRMLKRIADLVGFRLYDLVRNRLVPTAEAQELMRYVEYLDEQFDGLDIAISRLRSGGSREFRFGGSPSTGRAIVPEAMARFRQRFPQTLLHFDIVQLPSVVDYLALGVGECFVSVVQIEHAALERKEMCPARLVCVLPGGHPLAEYAALEPHQLKEQQLVVTDPALWYGQAVMKLLNNAGLDIRPSVIVRVPESVIGLVRVGLGLGIIDEFSSMGAEHEGLAVRPLILPAFSALYLHRSRDAPSSSYIGIFESLLASVLIERGSLGS